MASQKSVLGIKRALYESQLSVEELHMEYSRTLKKIRTSENKEVVFQASYKLTDGNLQQVSKDKQVSHRVTPEEKLKLGILQKLIISKSLVKALSQRYDALVFTPIHIPGDEESFAIVKLKT